MHFFARLKIKGRNLNSGDNIYAVTLADDLPPYRAGKAIVVRYGNRIYAAFFGNNNKISITNEAFVGLLWQWKLTRKTSTPN